MGYTVLPVTSPRGGKPQILQVAPDRETTLRASIIKRGVIVLLVSGFFISMFWRFHGLIGEVSASD